MKLKCTRPDCEYEWEYMGSSKFYATCPSCHNKVRLKVAKKKKVMKGGLDGKNK